MSKQIHLLCINCILIIEPLLGKQTTSTLYCLLQCFRWPMILFYNILDISAINAFIIWIHLNPTWNLRRLNRRRLFLKALGFALVKEHLKMRLQLSNLSKELRKVIQDSLTDMDPAKPTEDIQQHPCNTESVDTKSKRKRGRCKHCERLQDKKVRQTCERCCSFVCLDHSHVLCKTCNDTN